MRLLLFLCLVGALAANGQPVPPSSKLESVPMPPSLPPAPIDFRQLVSLTPAERQKALEGRSASDRQIIEAKLAEYDALSPQEREFRLRSLQLRLYLRPLMNVSASNRVERLATIPQPDRDLIIERLKVWDQLSPQMQKEFLDNELAVRMLVHPELAVPITRVGSAMTPQQQASVENAIRRWKALPLEKRNQINQHFQLFFQLNEKEKARSLQSFSERERHQMERTLKVFSGLNERQRDACIAGLRRFTQLSPEQRAEFLRNAELWQNMSSEDRKLWRELVARFRPPTPPFPPVPPPALPKPPVPARTSVQLTNN